ncbi:hypothetical protein CLV01_1470 [Delftia sp. 60]|uniref:hypothetical protein n=1 Tax=Delftia sp. 60 TaxID=2035216 RepID=UPI000C6172BF|nr:hypothetical protein [Delftia sp. 60]PIF39682.1 hypothetical protein CLU98_4975 [Burkholderiales bacterium 23]PIF65137.1 hypothetical protein CLV01_1470 [Delftia sp. 60]
MSRKPNPARGMHTACLLASALALASCASQKVAYLPDEQQRTQQGTALDLPQERKAVVEFSTDFYAPTYFERMAEGEQCRFLGGKALASVRRMRQTGAGEEAVGTVANVLTLGLAGLFDPRNSKEPHVFVQEFEAGRELALRARSFAVVNNVSQSCGPVYLRFVPEAGRRYRVQFEQEGRVCDARVLNVDVAGSTAEAAVPAGVSYSRWLCTEGFMGIGMNEVIGYREFAR